jgi:hypothetical protein
VLAPFTVNGVTITAHTTQRRWPSILDVDWPVTVRTSGTHSGTHELMGSGSAGGGIDGQARYELRFSEPQRRAGVQRNWSTYSLTRFYNSSGDVLAEHRNTANREFVGHIAEGDAPATWIARIEIDGAPEDVGGRDVYQVGHTDDLFFGQGEVEAPAPSCIIHGSGARQIFERAVDQAGDILVDFNDVPNGPLRTLTVGEVELSFATTLQRYPSTQAVDWPVVVIPYDFVGSTPSGTNELMGVRSSAGMPDGQSSFVIRFSEPQRRAGVQRNWSTFSITRFYGANDQLLGEHSNTMNREFVGFIAGGDDPAHRVSYIVVDGANDGNGTYQAGVADDLFFGDAPLDPGAPLRVLSFTGSATDQLSIIWAPPLEEAWLEFSTDAQLWEPLAGPVRGCQWTGAIPEGDEAVGLVRVRSAPPEG